MDKRQAAWQGAWSGDVGGIGNKGAFEVRGNKATVVDKKGTSEMTFSVDSPCTARFSHTDDSGLTSWTSVVYTLQAGKLVTGSGMAGSRDGERAVFCNGFTVFTHDGKTCTAWSELFGETTSATGSCGIRSDGDTEVFFYAESGRGYSFPIEGDLIWSDQLKRNHATPHADLAAAKTAAGL